MGATYQGGGCGATGRLQSQIQQTLFRSGAQLGGDEEHLSTFYAFPAAMHRHIQSTNAIESLFSNMRQRTDQIDVLYFGDQLPHDWMPPLSRTFVCTKSRCNEAHYLRTTTKEATGRKGWFRSRCLFELFWAFLFTAGTVSALFLGFLASTRFASPQFHAFLLVQTHPLAKLSFAWKMCWIESRGLSAAKLCADCRAEYHQPSATSSPASSTPHHVGWNV